MSPKTSLIYQSIHLNKICIDRTTPTNKSSFFCVRIRKSVHITKHPQPLQRKHFTIRQPTTKPTLQCPPDRCCHLVSHLFLRDLCPLLKCLHNDDVWFESLLHVFCSYRFLAFLSTQHPHMRPTDCGKQQTPLQQPGSKLH